MRDVYIISAVRTPIGRFGGTLKNESPVDLAAHSMKAALERAGLDGGELDLVIHGNVLRAGHGQLIPRQASLQAGVPDHVDGMAVDMVCSSGMMSVMTGATQIKAGEADLILAGGTESMSQAGFYQTADARWGYKYVPGSGAPLQDILYRDGLSDPSTGEAMGDQTERLAAEKGITREELDEIAAESHRRAVKARENGHFQGEIAPYEVKTRKGTKTLDHDEGVRPDTTAEGLGGLRTAFKKDGVLTAGNSSQISDGASTMLLASAEAVERLGLEPIAKLLGSAWSAGETWRFPEAPIPAVQKVLEKTGHSIEDFDLFENNEAFAINSILFNRELGVDLEDLNIHGGAVALGHPIGASGARITTTLIHALHSHDKQLGLAAICHGTGGGTALAVERV